MFDPSSLLELIVFLSIGYKLVAALGGTNYNLISHYYFIKAYRELEQFLVQYESGRQIFLNALESNNENPELSTKKQAQDTFQGVENNIPYIETTTFVDTIKSGLLEFQYETTSRAERKIVKNINENEIQNDQQKKVLALHRLKCLAYRSQGLGKIFSSISYLITIIALLLLIAYSFFLKDLEMIFSPQHLSKIYLSVILSGIIYIPVFKVLTVFLIKNDYNKFHDQLHQTIGLLKDIVGNLTGESVTGSLRKTSKELAN